MKRCRGRLHDNMQINSHSHSIQSEMFTRLTSSEKEDVKIECADSKAEVYWKHWAACLGEISYFVVYSVLENTSDSSDICRRPESQETLLQQFINENLQHVIWHAVTKERWVTKFYRAWKRNKKKAKRCAFDFDCTSRWLWELNWRCVSDATVSHCQRSTANKRGEAVNTHLISAVIP